MIGNPRRFLAFVPKKARVRSPGVRATKPTLPVLMRGARCPIASLKRSKQLSTREGQGSLGTRRARQMTQFRTCFSKLRYVRFGLVKCFQASGVFLVCRIYMKDNADCAFISARTIRVHIKWTSRKFAKLKKPPTHFSMIADTRSSPLCI